MRVAPCLIQRCTAWKRRAIVAAMGANRWTNKSIELTLEEPDIVVYRVVGKDPLDIEAMRWLISNMEEIQNTREHLYVLVELGMGSRLTTEARQELKSMQTDQPNTLVFFGGNMAARALAHVVLRGLIMLGKMKVRMVHHKDELQARQWILEDRATRTVG